MILDNPSAGMAKENILHKEYLERCQHLEGDEPGEFSCGIHEYAIYKDTPCFKHSQVEKHEEEICRMGKYQMERLDEGKNWLDEVEILRGFHNDYI